MHGLAGNGIFDDEIVHACSNGIGAAGADLSRVVHHGAHDARRG